LDEDPIPGLTTYSAAAGYQVRQILAQLPSFGLGTESKRQSGNLRSDELRFAVGDRHTGSITTSDKLKFVGLSEEKNYSDGNRFGSDHILLWIARLGPVALDSAKGSAIQKAGTVADSDQMTVQL
jgi:hypothetical protein